MSASWHREAGIRWGLALLLAWIYYSLWVIFLPFCEESFVRHLFPERRYAIEGAVLIGMIFTCGVSGYMGLVFYEDANKAILSNQVNGLRRISSAPANGFLKPLVRKPSPAPRTPSVPVAESLRAPTIDIRKLLVNKE